MFSDLRGGLKVIYPDLLIDKCLIVPQKVREKISKVWGPPQVHLPGVKEVREIYPVTSHSVTSYSYSPLLASFYCFF